ncbi:MAG TPA: hypothetical protein VMT75_12870 [Candidatus Saccharimonadales bacterium]|nr:hypothetical protein [Candidatus Saccharimonadales bacterium]
MLTLTPNPIFQRDPQAAQNELHRRTALTRTTTKRQMVDARQRKNAVRDIQALPGLEESLHIIARGNFPLWSIVPAVLTLTAPATIDHLAIATLGFSKANALDLFSLLDTGKVKTVSIVCSVFFERQNPAEYRMMADGLKERGHRISALRAHAKIIAMKLSDKRGITVESSANLRSCRNLEQLTIINSEPLRKFHAGWIEEVIVNGSK